MDPDHIDVPPAVPRFHRPRWSDVCDECIGECVCGKVAARVEGCECSQNRDALLALLKKLRVDRPELFKGVFQQEHKPCAACSRYIYAQLKRENAKRALARKGVKMPRSA